MRTVRIASTSGAVTVIAERRDDIEQSGSEDVVLHGSTATINGSHSRITVRVPEGIDVVVGATSGRVSLTGRLGAVAVVAESGRVSIEAARSIDVRASSGRVTIGSAERTCRVVSMSGRVTIDECGGADVTTGSGRVTIGAADGPVRAHCGSGGIRVTMSAAHDVDLDTVSGRVSVSLPAGVRPQIIGTSASSDIAAPPFDCVVTARSVSGRVRVETR